MDSSITEPATRGLLGPDPGRIIRIWVAMLLRLGIGLSLLGSGLAGYYGFQSTGSPIDQLLSGMPYVSIGLGLALILGFLTTASAIGAGLFSLILPVSAIIQSVLAGSAGVAGYRGMSVNDQFLTMLMTSHLYNLLTHAAMIWLSPLENNPFSVDAMIFGRNELAPGDDFAPAEPISGPAPVAEPEPPLQIGE